MKEILPQIWTDLIVESEALGRTQVNAGGMNKVRWVKLWKRLSPPINLAKAINMSLISSDEWGVEKNN